MQTRGETTSNTSRSVQRYLTTTTTKSLFLTLNITNITPPANSKANQGRWCVDGLRFITIVKVKKYHIYNKKGHSRKEGKRKERKK